MRELSRPVGFEVDMVRVSRGGIFAGLYFQTGKPA
jgi:hypothetical protein